LLVMVQYPMAALAILWVCVWGHDRWRPCWSQENFRLITCHLHNGCLATSTAKSIRITT